MNNISGFIDNLNQDYRVCESCEHCKDWGSTVKMGAFSIRCPKCGRDTHPWEGVNVPKGSAWALATGAASMQALDAQRRKS